VQQRSRDTVDILVTAAGRLLVDKGYGATTTADVARVAGVSIGSLYQYFEDKDAIFSELLRRHRDEVHALVEVHLRAFADPCCDPVAEMDALLRALVALHRRDPALMRVLKRELGDLHEDAANRHGQLPEPPVAVIEQLLVTHPATHVDDPRATAELLVVIVSHVAEWLAHDASPDLDPEPVLGLMRQVIAGLLGCR